MAGTNSKILTNEIGWNFQNAAQKRYSGCTSTDLFFFKYICNQVILFELQ